MRRDHGLEAIEAIDRGLDGYQPIPIDPNWQEKLDALHDFEALAWFQAEHGRISPADAIDAIDDFIVHIEAADNPYLM